ncbi:MAG: class I SAM-dependent methyltransferase family protein [Zetaproteobacteria bacterium]|nr:class I SAM-dependent methyltransferase family protein [Zetaproteobacteria bacterium]
MSNVRQERFYQIPFSVQIEGSSFSVADFSNSGLACIGDKAIIDAVGEVVEAKIIILGREICTIPLRKVRTEMVQDRQEAKLCLESDAGLPTAKIFSAFEVARMLETYASEGDMVCQRFPEVYHKTLEISDLLRYLKEYSQQNLWERYQYQCRQEDFEQGLIESMSVELKALFDEFYRIFVNLKPSVDDINLVFQYVRSKLSDLYGAPAAKRFLDKPLGYAGDYEMMNVIYKNLPEGDSLMARVVHHYVVNHDNSKAVRNRIVYLTDKIGKVIQQKKGQTVKILSVASGPAEEVKHLPAYLEKHGIDAQRVTVNLLDQDLLSLQYAQMNIRSQMASSSSKFNIEFINSGVRDLLKGRVKLQDYDLIYSAGLFDYLDDGLVRRLSRMFYEALAPQGLLIIGNFDHIPENIIFMDALLDWKLIYRTADEMTELVSVCGGKVQIEREPAGVNIFANIQK